MRGFWLPIGLRAAAIFAFGMLIYAGGRFLKSHTHFRHHPAPEVVISSEAAQAADQARLNAVAAGGNAVQAAVNAGLRARLADKALLRLGALSSLAGVGRTGSTPPDFRMDGTRIGSLIHFHGSRAKADTPAEFALVVRLDKGRQASACDLAPVQPDDFELDRGFRCAAAGETALVRVGSVRFEPTGGTRAVKASSRMAQELAKGDPFRMDADLTGPLNLVVNGKGGDLVRLQSDSQNTALVVRDDQGKEVVRMQAGKDGFSISVDTTGH